MSVYAFACLGAQSVAEAVGVRRMRCLTPSVGTRGACRTGRAYTYKQQYRKGYTVQDATFRVLRRTVAK